MKMVQNQYAVPCPIYHDGQSGDIVLFGTVISDGGIDMGVPS